MAEQKLPKLLTSAVFRHSASQNNARKSRLETNAWLFRAKQNSAPASPASENEGLTTAIYGGSNG